MMHNNQPKFTFTKQTYEKFDISSVFNIFKFLFKFKLLFKCCIKSFYHGFICKQRQIEIMVKKKNYIACKEKLNIPI